jgi:hypothetical protein
MYNILNLMTLGVIIIQSTSTVVLAINEQQHAAADDSIKAKLRTNIIIGNSELNINTEEEASTTLPPLIDYWPGYFSMNNKYEWRYAVQPSRNCWEHVENELEDDVSHQYALVDMRAVQLFPESGFYTPLDFSIVNRPMTKALGLKTDFNSNGIDCYVAVMWIDISSITLDSWRNYRTLLFNQYFKTECFFFSLYLTNTQTHTSCRHSN